MYILLGSTFPVKELKQQNVLLSQTKALLQEEVNSLHSKVEKLAELQAENAALSVQVESLEKESQEESVHMQELLQQNVHLELDRDKKYVQLFSKGGWGVGWTWWSTVFFVELHVVFLIEP